MKNIVAFFPSQHVKVEKMFTFSFFHRRNLNFPSQKERKEFKLSATIKIHESLFSEDLKENKRKMEIVNNNIFNIDASVVDTTF